MSERLQSVINRLVVFTVILIISAGAAFLLTIAGVTRNIDTALYDACINSRVADKNIKKSPFIAAVDLNDASIDILGESLDTREAFADVVRVLSDSNASAFLDFLFRHEKTGDDVFVNEIEFAHNIVIASLAVDEELFRQPNMPYKELTGEERSLLDRHVWRIEVIKEGKIPEAKTFLLPLPSIMEAAAQIAHINIRPDPDGIYRRVPLLYKWEDGFIPALSLAAGALYWNIAPETIVLKAGEYLLLPLPLTEKEKRKNRVQEVIRIPIDEYGNVLVPYTETWVDQQNRIPFHKIAKAKYDDDAFEEVFSDLNGRIALLAEISTSQKDFGPTSFESLYPLSGVHAEILSGILDFFTDNTFIRSNTQIYKNLILIILIIAAFIFFNFKRDIIFHLGIFLIVSGFSLNTLMRWKDEAIAPWFAFPFMFLLFFWISEFVCRLFSRYRQQLLLHSALSRYFPHALAQRIMKEKKTDLKPAYKELTILFSDISGFTKWSSDKNPEDVHDFLNDYLESMAEILFAHGGTVDKFMGDGILAFFGDPFEMHNHTEQCINAAIAMQKKVRILAEKWKPVVGIDLNVRVGINTGKVIVGNLGSKTRIEYTVIGAAVNLAQRMESNAPVGGILVTSDVKEKVKDAFNFPERKDVTVKGYAESIEAYVVEL